ncbi:tyrosine-type recombinase/integrase [Micromonospora zamorensis]|uniref:tyrosine-type recombinase/integrase n=1 Tax=Micromonospora zamorensis TaxID=709883 RepID=UPI0036ABFCF7
MRLRHYFATRLITSGADPTDVQNALRHSSLRITLETYVHWWPKKDPRRNIISGALRDASAKQNEARRPRILAELCRICARRSWSAGFPS